jgi:hypothetical protein
MRKSRTGRARTCDGGGAAQADLRAGSADRPHELSDLLNAVHRTGEKHAFPEHGAGIIVIWEIESLFN